MLRRRSSDLPRATRRTVALCGAVVLVDTLFYAVLSPLLSSYEADAGLTSAQVGLLVAAYPLGTILGAVPAGLLASRRGPRAAVVLGVSITAVTCLLFATSTTGAELVGYRFVQGIGGALSWTGALVWVSAVAPPPRRGELLGVLFGLSVVGGMAGPVVGGVASLVGVGPVFRCVALLCAVLVVVALRVPAARPAVSIGWRATRPRLADRRIRVGLWLTAYGGIGFGVINTSAPLSLVAFGLTAAAVAGVFLLMATVATVGSPLIGRAGDRRGHAWAARLLVSAAAVATLLTGFAGSVWVLVPLLVLAATALEAVYVPAGALVVEGCAATDADTGVVLSLTNLVWASGMAVSSVVAGSVVGLVGGDWAPYVLVALTGLLTLPAIRRLPTTGPAHTVAATVSTR